MKDACRLLFVSCLGLGIFAIPAAADAGGGVGSRSQEKSHTAIPLETARITGFLARLERIEQQARLKEMLNKLLKDAVKDPVNAWKQTTELQKEVQKLFAKSDAAGQFDRDAVRQLLEQFHNTNRGPAGSPELLDPEMLREQLRQLSPEQLRNLEANLRRALPKPGDYPKPNREPVPPAPRSTPPAPDVREGARPPVNEDVDAEGWFEQWLLQQVKRIDPNHAMFQSPALQDMLREVGRFTKTEEWDRLPKNTRFNGISKRFVDGVRQLNLQRLGSHVSLPPVRNISLAPSTSWRLPRLRLPSFNWSSPSMPGLGTPSAPATPQRGFLTVALTVALIGLVWFLWARQRKTALAAVAAAVPVSWPVAPEAVSTKDELIRAFEYVSLLRLGLDARCQHHRALAAGLGGTEPGRRWAAQQLADLYEQARYAPDDAPLTQGAVANARSSLALLAGETRP